MPTIVHFAMSADNTDRAKKFYEALFDWKFERHPGSTEYHLITTMTLDGKDGVAGGMAPRRKPDQKITNFIGVPSIDDYLKKVEELGGKIIEPKMAVPNVCYIAVCQDTEGNEFGLLEENKEAQ